MSYLYIIDQGATLSFSGNRFVVNHKDKSVQSFPSELIEIIEIFGNVQVTTQCMTVCLRRGVNILFFSTKGSYYGRLISTSHVNVERQRLQAELTRDDEFCLAFSKRITDAKINNQIVLARRYSRSRGMNLTSDIDDMQRMQRKVWQAEDVASVMGYEGRAARVYFNVLSNLVEAEFKFNGRSRRPPRDAFNSMLSLGYTIIMHEIYGKLEGKGLNAYFGVMHQDHEKHPTLASDLMEEWRTIIVDAVVMSMINGHEVSIDEFTIYEDNPGVFLSEEAFKKFIKKIENKLIIRTRYLRYVDYVTSFRQAMDLQVNQFVKALESGNPEMYMPVKIR